MNAQQQSDPGGDVEALLAAARAAEFIVPLVDLVAILPLARREFNRFWKGRPPEVSDDRLILEHLRDAAGFRDKTEPLHTLPGARRVRIELHARVLAAIVARYPNLAAEAELLQNAYVRRNAPAPKRRPR